MQSPLPSGSGVLFADPSPDNARRIFAGKPRSLTDKRRTVAEAVRELVHDGDYLAIGGFGTNRIPTAIACMRSCGKKNKISPSPAIPLPTISRSSAPATLPGAAKRLAASTSLTWSASRRAGSRRIARRVMESGRRRVYGMDQLRPGGAPASRGDGRAVLADAQHARDRHVPL